MLKVVPIEIKVVPPGAVTSMWHEVQKSFRKAQRHSLGENMDEAETLKRLREGRAELLVAVRGEEVIGGIILQFYTRPKGRCCIMAAAMFHSLQDMQLWTPLMHEYLAEHAKRRNCYVVETFARDGMIEPLKQLGWRRKATVMEMV